MAPQLFTLNDLERIRIFREKRKDGIASRKEAEILIDEIGYPLPDRRIVGVERLITVSLYYRGRLYDGTRVRTVKFHFEHRHDTYKPDEQSIILNDKIHQDYPRAGDVIPVYWYKGGPLPSIFAGERYIHIAFDPREKPERRDFRSAVRWPRAPPESYIYLL